MSSIVYWQPMEDRDQWGLLSVPYRDASVENIRYNSGFYAMKQFSKYIRKGYRIIYISNPRTIAAYDQQSQLIVFVITNDANEPVDDTYDLGILTSFSSATAIRTSPTEQNEDVTSSIITDPTLRTVKYISLAQSITTILIHNAIFQDSATHLISSDFETAEDANEWIDQNGNGNSGVSMVNSFRGVQSGFLEANAGIEEKLYRTIIAPATSKYYLSAWCSTTGLSTRIGAAVNGGPGPEVQIGQNTGYRLYSLVFEANINDVITIYYRAIPSAPSYIDDVILTMRKSENLQILFLLI